MARVLAQATTLLSRDVPAAMAHWRDVFGFAVDNTFGEPPTFAILKRDWAWVMIGQADTPIVPRRRQRDGLFDAYFWIDDARAEFEAMRKRGARVDFEPYLQPYGVLEFGLLDPDEQLISFGQVMT
jgi:predicted enzyme related to lactoylglutathione lyase